MLKMTNMVKVIYATYMLKSHARVWWNLLLETVRITNVTWADFRKLFEAEYKTTTMNYLRAQKFINLTQGNNIVKNYSIRFNVFIRFAPGMMSAKLNRMKKFIHKLNLTIACDVMMGSMPS